MSQQWSRRQFVHSASGLGAFGLVNASPAVAQGPAPSTAAASSLAADAFPVQDPALAREVVGVSHRDLPAVRALVERQPALARASIDWGFGDWEAAIDAASHVGRRDIAEFLIASGARPTIFSAAMLGQIDVVKAFVLARPGVQRTYGPHGITLLAHARAGGADAAAVVQYLTTLGDADVRLPSAPLASSDRDALVGRYVFGAGSRDYFDVDVRSDLLGLERPGTPGRRNLIHQGDLVFFPSGVPTVRIAFLREGGRVTRFTVADPAVVVTARRA